MAGRSSLREIAQELGLSVPTVSRALGGYTDIAKSTRERVAETARRLGYEPNSAGRMLASGKSGFVGLVLPVGERQFVDAYLGALVAGLSEGLAERELQLMIATVAPGHTPLETISKLVNARRVDGLVLTRLASEDPRVAYLQEREIPFVTMGRQRDGLPDHPWLDVDDGAAFAEAVELLAGLGHRHLGLVSITDDMSFARHREDAVQEACARLGLRLAHAAAPRADRDARMTGIAAMLSGPDRPTAALGLFDGIALDVMTIAGRHNLRVPEDLSVIGFDDISGAAYAATPLTTFNPSNRDLGRKAAQMLADLLARQEGTPPHILNRAEFVPRASHGPAPTS